MLGLAPFSPEHMPAGLHFVEVPDDHLEPTLRRRDFVLLEPVGAYAGEGVYLVRDPLGGLASFRADIELKPGAPRVRLWCENERYTIRHVAIDRFAEIVVGKAVMTCRVLDHRLRQSAAA